MTQSFIKSMIKSAKAAVVAALALVFWAFGAAGAFFVRAQDKGTDARETVLRVYYRFDSAAIMASYMSNAASLETVDSLATVCAANGVSGLQITSFSSLEGSFSYNANLSERRANALKDYIVELHPLLRSRINTNVQAESWEDLKNFVLADSRFNDTEKKEIVDVIDSDDEPDAREARLKKLSSYGRLYAAYFRSLRYAEIRFVADPAAAVAPAASTAVASTGAGETASSEAGAATGTTAAGTAAQGTKTASSCAVLFPASSNDVVRDYASNGAALEEIAKILGSHNPEDFESIVITSASSIEGDSSNNVRVSREYAENLASWIEQNYPQYKGRIVVNPCGEDWNTLRSAVESDSTLNESERNSILAIVDSDDNPDSKEARLKELSSWNYLKDNVLPQTRRASVDYNYSAAAAGTQAGETAADGTQTVGTASSEAGAATGTAAQGTKTASSGAVLFPASSNDVVRDYASNDAALTGIANLLSSHNPEDFESIVITSASSIEGDSSNNVRVSREYAENLASWIEQNYPQYKGRIVVNPCGEDWNTLRSAVESDSTLNESERNSILAIVDSDDNPDSKEARLKELSSWNYLKDNVLPQTRRASVDYNYSAAAAGTQAGETASQGTQTGKTGTGAATSGTSVTREADGTTVTRETEGTAHVLFPLNGTTVKSDHANNSEVFDEIAKILDGRKPEDFESIVVRSSSSIDGPVSSNDNFSRERGESLVKWIEDNYPEYKGHVVLESNGEDWDAFKEAVKADKNLDDNTKNTILEIANSDESADKREERLRKLPEWEGYIKDNILPLTRRASMHATRAKVEAPEPEALPDVNVEDETLTVDDTRDSLDTTVAPVDTLAAPVAPELRKPLFAVSTNALYDLAITPNFAIEVPVGKKVSIFGEYTFPWWVSRDNSRAWQILKWDLGARYWFFGGRSENPMDVMIGPFAGIDLGAGYYDIEPHHKGWQGEFQTVGLEIGWAWDLGKDWRLDAFVGAGWLGSHARIYEGSSDDKHLIFQDYGKLTWFGPTKAGVSIKYIFGHNDRRTEK